MSVRHRHSVRKHDSLTPLAAACATLMLVSCGGGGGDESPAALPQLAEAFYGPDAASGHASGNVGLRLYLARLVAQAHGGGLRIRLPDPGLEVARVRPAQSPT